jgi:Asp/Glu/hydantoin racemase
VSCLQEIISMPQANSSPRIVLVHAVAVAVAPIHQAFAEHWPEARLADLLDTSLSADLAEDKGQLGRKMIDRFLTLGRYAAASGPEGRSTDGVLFTCSAFGPAIEAVASDLKIPVAKPNEAAFKAALERGSRIGLVTTFAPSIPPLRAELLALAKAARPAQPPPSIVECVVPEAMAALQAGRGDEHDARVAQEAAKLKDVDVIVLGQFSTARAASAVAGASGKPVITTPESAVVELKARLGG